MVKIRVMKKNFLQTLKHKINFTKKISLTMNKVTNQNRNKDGAKKETNIMLPMIIVTKRQKRRRLKRLKCRKGKWKPSEKRILLMITLKL
jgi:hypothetical protein